MDTNTTIAKDCLNMPRSPMTKSSKLFSGSLVTQKPSS